MASLPVNVDADLASAIVFFVYRTEAKGVPRRVAIQRAAKKFKLPNNVVRDLARRGI